MRDTWQPWTFNFIVLKHTPQTFEAFEDEVQFIIGHTKRSKFISNLALDLSGNTLVLFSRVESHGAILYEMINNKAKEGRKVFFIHGGVDAEDREEVRKITETEDDAIIVALMELSQQHQHQEPSQRDLCLSIKE